MKWWVWVLLILLIAAAAAWINRKRVMSKLKNIQLSKNFTLDEFVITATGIENIPGEKEIAALRQLCEKVLQPLRDAVGKPVIISSGYRSPLVNKAIGGSATSQHVKGEAADISIPGMNNQEIIDLIRVLKLPYDQVIDEQLWKRSGTGWRLSTWVHVSHNPKGSQRLQWMTARNTQAATKTIYATVKTGLA